MSDIATSLSSFFGGAGGKLLQTGLTGVGEVGNILNMIQRGQQYSALKKFENMTPQQLSARVQAGTAPLSAGLTQAVANAVQGSEAERGLSASPGILASDLSQSLAPYVQQNQNQALQLLMSQMGLPTQAASILNPVANLGNSWANLMKLWGGNSDINPSTLPGGSIPNFQDLIWGSGSPDALTDSPILQPSGANA